MAHPPVLEFEDYGFTAEQFKAHLHSALALGDRYVPDPDLARRIRQYLDDEKKLRAEWESSRAERRRKLSFGFWTLVGIVAWTALVALVTLDLYSSSFANGRYIDPIWQANILIFCVMGLILSFFFREQNRKCE